MAGTNYNLLNMWLTCGVDTLISSTSSSCFTSVVMETSVLPGMGAGPVFTMAVTAPEAPFGRTGFTAVTTGTGFIYEKNKIVK